MAKSKKSKILAMALCASVMTGIYASPVMAAYTGLVVSTTGGNKIYDHKSEIITIKGVTFKAGGVLTAGAGTFNTLSVAGNRFAVGPNGGIKAADGRFRVDANGNIIVKGALGGSEMFRVDAATGNVTAAGALNADTLTTTGDATVGGKLVVNGETTLTGKLSGQEATFTTVNANNFNGVTLANEADGVKVGGINVTAMDDRTAGLERKVHGAYESTYLEGAVRVNNNLGLQVLDNTNNVVASISRDGAVNAATLTTTGDATVGGNAEVKGTLSAADGKFFVGEFGGINAANGNFKVNKDGDVRAANGKFKVGADGDVRAANGKFNVGADGDVEIQYAGDGVIVADENGFAVQKGSAQTVVTNFGVANIYDDNRVEVNANGVGLAAGLKADGSAAAQISVTDDGIGLQGGTSEVVLNSNNGAVFTNGEGNGETVINGGSITTNRITTGTVNGVAIGMNADGDITLGDDIIIDDKFNSDNVAGITRDPLADSAPGGSNTTYIEKNTAISADGIVVRNPVSGVSTKTKYDGFYVKDKTGNNVSSLKDDGLMLTDQESGKQTLNATDIADIKGIDRSGNDTDGYKTTIEDATSFTKDGMVTSNITTGSFKAGVTGDSFYRIDATGEMLFRSGNNYIGMDRGRIGFTSGTESVTINGDGTTFTSGDSTTRTTTSTVIKGGTITTETLNVEKIVLGDKIVNKETGEVIGGELEIGADGSIKIADNFEVDTDNLAAHYVGEDDEYELTLDGTNGFALRNSKATLTLNDSGYTFSGPVNLGAGDEVGFTYAKDTGNEKYYTLDSLVDKVNDIYERTDGIYKDAEGNTVISNEPGEWNEDTKQTEHEGTGSKVTIGEDGATFENGADNGITNVNGGTVNTDSALVGDHESTAGGGTGTGATGDGTVTDSTAHSGQFADADSSYEFTNDANGFTGTVTGDNTSASSGVGIGNDGAFISDSVTNGDISHTVNGGDITNTVTDGSITDTVTNGDMTVTEVKDKNGSATTVKDANGSSTVSQDTKGQTVSTGTGTSVNTGNDFVVTDTDTGKSIYMSDIGHVEDIDSEIQNSDGSKTTVVDAVNNEAEIRRNEIERVDGRINNLENRVGKLEDRVDKVGAMAAAIANLRTMGYDPAAPTEVAVGIGQYRDETGAALGLFHYPNRDFMLSLSVSTSGDEVMGGIGATWKFGRKSPEKVAEIKKAQAEADARRAEEAKLAKAEEMKQAAKEAKIKAQQERHAKLAAELAAQAEAAK